MEKSNKSFHSILAAFIVVLLCSAMIVTGTYALFTDSFSQKTVLKAGTMKIRLLRTKLEYTELNGDGLFEKKTDDRKLVYAQPEENETISTENVFGIKNDTLLIPTSKYTATMCLENKSNVAFNYYLTIEGLGDAAKNHFSDKLTVIVDTNLANDAAGEAGGETKTTVSVENKAIGDASAPVGQVLIGGSAKFTVTVIFEGDATNDAQAQEANFNLNIHAVQVVAN